jgi:hypothetical protein
MNRRPRRRRDEGRPIEGFPNAKTFHIRFRNRTYNFGARWKCLIIILTIGFYLASVKKLQ